MMIDALFSFISTLLCRLLATELYAWAPAAADWLLRFYIRFLPQEVGERLLEEWRALLYDTPGNLAKLLRAIDLGRTMIKTKKEAEELDNSNKAITANTSQVVTLKKATSKVRISEAEYRSVSNRSMYVLVRGHIKKDGTRVEPHYRRRRGH